MLTSNRATNALLVLVLITGVAIVAMLATGGYAGPLDPPGAPASSDGVRGPGTPISSLPFVTAQGGYYYVTRPLSAAAGQAGITICCSNTTIDLGGFTITGAGAGNNPGDGISNPGARNIVIRNGAVRGWANGINLGGTYSRVVDVHALSNLTNGIVVGSESVVSDCNASLNGNFGVSVDYATVRNCTVAENLVGIRVGHYSLVEGNRANFNVQSGIHLTGNYSTARNNEATANNQDLRVSVGALRNLLKENGYCNGDDLGTGTVVIDTDWHGSAC